MRKQRVITRISTMVLLSLTTATLTYANPVNNPSMEGAFVDQSYLGQVAESWTGYSTRPPGEPEPDFYQAAPAYAHSGSKSQAIEWAYSGPWPFGPAGIYQHRYRGYGISLFNAQSCRHR